MRNAEDAEEVMWKVFEKVHNSLHNFNGDSSFYTWLRTIATNTALTFLTRKKRINQTVSIDDPQNNLNIDEILKNEAPLPSEVLNAKDISGIVSEALKKLSPKHREVLSLSLGGMSDVEIAKKFKRSPGTVRSQISYAKKHLRKFLRKFSKEFEQT